MTKRWRVVIQVVCGLAVATVLAIGLTFWRLLPHPLPAKPSAALPERVRVVLELETRGSVTAHLAMLNQTTAPEKTYKRQVRELALALWLAATWSREERVDAYGALVWTRGTRHGLEAGARHYFGRPLAALTPAELAVLVVLPRSPKQLDAACHPERALEARDALLGKMREAGLLTSTEEQQARDAPLGTTAACNGA